METQSRLSAKRKNVENIKSLVSADSEDLPAKRGKDFSIPLVKSMLEAGYYSGQMQHFTINPITQKKLLGLGKRLAKDLPPDPFDKPGTRSKLLSQLVIDPITGKMTVVGQQEKSDGHNYTTYHQTAAYNEEVSSTSKGRDYRAIPKRITDTPEFLGLIKKCWEDAINSGCINDTHLTACNIHIVEQRATKGRMSYTSPAVFHVDGEPCTFVILLHRDDNVVGGESFVGDRTGDVVGKVPKNVDQGHIRFELALLNPYDFIVVDDRAVAHHVNGIASSDGEPALRVTLLIDFTNLYPNLSGDVQ